MKNKKCTCGLSPSQCFQYCIKECCPQTFITIAQRLGKLGGLATKKKLGIEHFKKISKLGVKARNEKLV